MGVFFFPPEWEDCNNYGVTSPATMGPLCGVQLPRPLVDLRLGEERGTGWRCRASPALNRWLCFADASFRILITRVKWPGLKAA